MRSWTRAAKRRPCQLALVVALAAFFAPGPVLAQLDATVTSVRGQATAGNAPLAASGRVAEGDRIESGSDGSCSLLVDRTAVVQFCGRTVMRFREAPSGSDARILEVSEGAARTTVGPRSPEAPLEIHTPAAVAVIMGTVVSVKVDPETGETTFVLEEGRVRIRSRDGQNDEVTLEAGQKLTVRPGEKLARPERLELADVAPVAGCLDDRLYRAAALDVARLVLEKGAPGRIAEQDIPGPDEINEILLPPVGTGPVLPAPPESPVSEPPGVNPCDDPTLCGEPPPPPPPPPPLPPLPVNPDPCEGSPFAEGCLPP